ncbi:RagB/SusD family nutrient uptake outer membrane protein [Pedobacter sp. P351]|uniref:RagB/SusD family nutrient uptake outer membrane protein n=1 Tax=Pedobacter superstes TaxID=3133441 RepID=UPI00309B8097
MIKNIKYKILLVMLVLSSTSCNKWLELKPQDGIVREDFWTTKEQLQSAVIGCYTSLLNPTLVTNMFIWGELRADMVVLNPSAGQRPEDVNYTTAEILPTSALVNWSSLYTTINYCNTVIEFGPQVLASDPTLTQQQLNGYLAEARALRGLMYFYLLRVWGEVPLQLKASSSDSNIEQLAKSSKEEVFNQIVSDLDFAAVNAVTTYGTRLNEPMDKGRITTYAVYAIQADVYLWMDKYEECVAACDKVINSGRFGLIEGGNAGWFNTVFVQGNSAESIFEIQFDNQALNPWYNTFANVPRFVASALVTDELYGTDAVDPMNVKDVRGDGASFRVNDKFIWKHIGTNNINNTVTANSSNRHWFLYRYADILLLKAEALAWLSRGQESLDLINVIRDRANALPVTEQSPDIASPEELSDYILAERAREFAFEGKRWFDLLRHAKRNDYARLDLITNMIATIAPSDIQQSMITKYRDVRSHYLPIAFSELQADKLLEQNAFYK